MDFSSIRPSSWNGVGAIAKVPAAARVNFVIFLPLDLAAQRGASKPPRAHFDLFFREEDLAGMFNDVLRIPTGMRRLPARFLHHPHLAHAARAGDAKYLAGLVTGEIADHV